MRSKPTSRNWRRLLEPSKLHIGISGAAGFVGRHFIERINQNSQMEAMPCPRDIMDNVDLLSDFVTRCHAFVHLAAVNREKGNDVYECNTAMAQHLATACQRGGSRPHVLFTSSIQRDRDNPYGRSKQAAEKALTKWATDSNASLSIFIVPNVYGAGCRPFYNSVVATFCHQLASGETPTVMQDEELELVWVNDLVDRMMQELCQPPDGVALRRIEGSARLRVTELLEILQGYREDFFERKIISNIADPMRASLYTTYLSYLNLDDHRHPAEVRADNRGRLFEIVKLANGGQVFFSTTHPGVVRGDHYHRRKLEWFCVVQGEAVIRLRNIGETEIKEYRVSGQNPVFISIPVFYTHHIENVGQQDLLTMFWCNEVFDPSDADTYFEPVGSRAT